MRTALSRPPMSADPSGIWVVDKMLIDTGATTHLEHTDQAFVTKYRVGGRVKIQVASGAVCTPDFIGCVKYQVEGITPEGAVTTVTVVRDNVICCKQLTTSLFSPRRDWDVEGTRVVFEDKCRLTLSNGTEIQFEETDGAYLLKRTYRPQLASTPVLAIA